MESFLRAVATLRAEQTEVERELAGCDFSRLGEYGNMYYRDVEAMLLALKGIKSAGPESESAMSILLDAIVIEAEAMNLRHTAASLELAEGTTTGCAGGDSDSKDQEALKLKEDFVNIYNKVAAPYGVKRWQADEI